MTSLLKSLIGPPMCENCGVQPKFATFDYCGKTCAAEAEKKKRTRASRTTQPITGSTSIASNSSSAQAMCQNCHLKPVVPGHRYCSKTCGDSAKKAGATPLDDQSISGMRAPQPVAGSTSTTSNTSTDQKMCRNCRSKPIFPGHDYCGKTCADWVKSQENSVAQTASASGPPNSAAGPKSRSYNSSDNVETPVSNPPATSNLCEHCFTYVKSREMEEDGTIVTHSHCGIGCYKAAQHTVFASSTIPAPAAASVSQNSLRLRAERMNTPVGRKVLLMVQERWQSEIVRIPQVKGIYRIDLPVNIYQRFDLALQMNEDCTIKTTYYGGIATCSITDDTDPAPCAFESCDLCDALHSSFGNLLQGGSCRDGSYGPGLYTYSNPALAHDMMVSGYARQAQKVNYALVQCRVVIQADYMPSSNSYAGFIDDSGVAFCAQSTAIIPTHLLIYSLDAPPDTQQPAGSVNTDVASVGPAVSAATPASGGLGQPKSSTNTGYGEMKLKSAKGKGKARANGPLQEPQRQRSDMGSSSIYYSSQQVAPGGTGAAASQTVPTPLPPSLTPTGRQSELCLKETSSSNYR
ncbi:hypothetical protein M407DRAFT_19622 [Tulasnella calospora MUT 4182]|uniref:Uncharacterized protein n=1 Tax=Tulasnella calospora MUT 4182 TaxID=1051891 RepID=A0A0C3QHT5_9AGAM|nr:hypothetical protein M407DRAFT_19622 [Tulasnella calospora MUT 4182]